MVSVEDSLSLSLSNSTRFPLTREFYGSSSPSASRIHRHVGRSMRTIRSNFYQSDHHSCCSADKSGYASEILTDSVIDMRLGELASKKSKSVNSNASSGEEELFLDISQAFSDFSACSSDISGELQRLASLQSPDIASLKDNGGENGAKEPEPEPEPCLGFLQRDNFSTEIIESISPEDLLPTVKLCIDGLQSSSAAVKRSAAAKLRLLAKNRADNRVLIGESGSIPVLIPLLRSNDPWTQEHAVTALLNLSLHEQNKALITKAGAIKSLVWVLKTGTETSKQNAACALLSLALVEENKGSIGACGAIPPLVALLMNGSCRGKKDALTTLYKLCTLKQNKERAVTAGAVKPLVELVAEQGTGMAEKAMVVLSSLAAIEEGTEAIVEEGKEFAVLTLLQLCADSVRNRGLLVREGGIPPLVALSQSSCVSVRAKRKAERLLGYLREPRQEGCSTKPLSQ
ncbi:PREDICTED: LOW QUALITY PROTEIN: U-box domain-containing protein 4 [Tarenaya hassleriana]|uniref:LOW QUALITY PROTEIN: U-box domain-containing protein 4 n=1 Tax=Tarenaya hassleriana TaxID=28532 RepID=UPI00053CA55F|nr:PREDICTED: LOW QUALITY PROTEIN: U-box domain-containing protein 4 [Tarenaya hassleriana]